MRDNSKLHAVESITDPENRPPIEPEPLLKVCPTCHFTHQTVVPQCQKCGTNFVKLRDPRDPKQIEAERRLAQLSKMSSSGLPKRAWMVLILLVGLPVSLFFIPDIGARVLGASLKYNMANKRVLTYQGSCTVTIGSQIGDEGAMAVNRDTNVQVMSLLETRIELKGKDSGGNATYKISYPKFVIDGIPGQSEPIQTPEATLGAWGENVALSAHGKKNTFLDTEGLQAVANAARHQANLLQHGSNSYNQGGGYEDPSGTYFSLSREEIPFYHMNLKFLYPDERIHSGTAWTQPMPILVNAGLFKVTGKMETAEIRLTGFSRSLKGFNAILEWWGNFSPIIVTQDNAVQAMVSRMTISSDYRGKAWVNYSDGMINKVEGTVTLTMNGDPADADFFIKRFNPRANATSGSVILKCQQRIMRI